MSYFERVLSLAEQRRGFCAPNPAVGAVVVKDGAILSEGFHWAAGRPHAEVEALQKLTLEQSRQSTVYLSLEPCCHFGRTPPCTNLLIQRQVKEVFYAYQDPNPVVAGKGEQQLKEAGITCQQILVPEIEAFYSSYHHWTLQRRPRVTAKIALSLDGKIAGPKGEPVAITGAELQLFTHQWRYRSDAILTTAKTINHDNPQLNVRLGNEVYQKPVYILDTHLSIIPTARIFATASRVTIFYREGLTSPLLDQLLAKGVRCQPIPTQDHYLDLAAALAFIGQDGAHDLWVEAGGTCVQSFVKAELAHRIFFYLSPKILGQSAQSAFTKALNLTARTMHWQPMGQDVVCEAHFW